MVKTPELGRHIHRVVRRKEVVSLLPMQSVVDITAAYVVKDPRFFSSVVKPNIS